MKMKTDHLPFRLASVISTNLPLWKAWFLNGWTCVLIRDMTFPLLGGLWVSGDGLLGKTIESADSLGTIIIASRNNANCLF